jgi:hypothetical protein
MANIDFYYDIDDFTLETIDDNGVVLNQGQTDSIEFRFYFGSYATGTFVNSLTAINMIDNPCLLNIERPDGSASNNVATTAVTSDLNNLHFKLTISDWVTEIAGTLEITTKRFNPITEIETTFGIANLNILASASQSDDTIEDAQYQALLSYLATTANNRMQVIADGAIDALDLVMFTGTVGGSGKIKVAKASQTGPINISSNPEYVFGIALTSATNNQEFYVQTEGMIEDVDTSGFEEGKVLVPSATIAGGLIEVDSVNAPQPPLNRMPIAAVVYSHQNQGILLVRPTFFPRMGQVKDVYVDYATIGQGEGLVWNSTTNRFETGFSGGVFYDNNLPNRDERFNNLTWFDEGPQGNDTWVLPTVYWNVQVFNPIVFNVYRSLVDAKGVYKGATKLEILDMGMNVRYQNLNVGLIDQAFFTINDNLQNYGLQNYGMYLLRMTFEYYNQDDIVVQDVRLTQFQYIIG